MEPNIEDSAVEEPFQGIFGLTSELSVAQHFVATRDIRFTQKEVADATGLARQTVASVLQKFVRWQVLASEQRGRERVFYLNARSPLAYALDTLVGAIVEEITGTEVLTRMDAPEEFKTWNRDWLLEQSGLDSESYWREFARPATRRTAAA